MMRLLKDEWWRMKMELESGVTKGGRLAGGKLGGTLDVILRSCATWGWEGLNINPPNAGRPW